MARRLKPPYQIEDFLGVIKDDIDDAVDYITEFEDEFEKGDRYFNGEVDIPVEQGRSKVVATLVRDSIRNIRPSVMRVLASNRRRLVKYIPNSLAVAPVVEQQEAYVHQLFWANNGYIVLYDAVDETLKHRMGPTKTYWESDPAPEYTKITMLTLDEVQFLSEMPNVEVLEIEESAVTGNGDVDLGDEVEFYDVSCLKHASNGRIVMEAVPYGEFFISRNARNTDSARVHGHRRSVTVEEAIEMGLDYDDWWDLDEFDPEQDDVGGQARARRLSRKDREEDRGDVLGHRFLLTECYVRLDLENVGYNQLYCLYLGGTSYKLIDYEREGESPFDVFVHDPRAFTVMGTSIPDVTMEDQDVITSMLRGTIDNIHLANNPRLGGNPQQVNFDDLMNFEIGHPIRFKGSGTSVQVVQVPSQTQAALPMLQYLEDQAQNKVGITKAAQGLDPNAMQSTDKDAVRNTIQLAQGQVELAVRNIIETGVIPLFRKLLKLSIQHMDRIQIVKMRGGLLPVDQIMLDPSLHAEAQVGLGTVPDEQRIAGLNFTLERQMMIYQSMGLDNPFVKATNIYNTLEDLTEMFGLYNVSRYYALVTPELEAEFAKKKAEQEAQTAAAGAQGGMDPVAGLLQSEQIKAGTEKLKLIASQKSDMLKLQLEALSLNAKDDLERDKMAQQREIQSAKVLGDSMVAVNQQAIKDEQDAPRDDVTGNGADVPATGGGTGGEGAPAPSPMPSGGGV